MKICLIGLQGAGKTTVGRWISSFLGIDFFDLDQSIAAKYSASSIRDVFRTLGEEEFHKEEVACLKPILERSSYVIALGGGAVDALDRIPDDVYVVYLFRSLETLEREFIPPFPVWADARDPLASLRQRWEERHPLYFQRATSVVIVEKRSVEDDAKKVLYILKDFNGKQ